MSQTLAPYLPGLLCAGSMALCLRGMRRKGSGCADGTGNADLAARVARLEAENATLRAAAGTETPAR